MTRDDREKWADVRGAVLLAGDAQSLPDMLAVADLLPPAAHATMLIEAFAAAQICEVAVRDDIRVSWLVRSDAGHDRDARSRGERLATAIHAWCAEWACSADGEAPQCTVWLAAHMPTRIVRMTRALIDPTPRRR